MDQILRQIRYELQQARFLAEQQAAERLRLALNNEAYREADAEVSRCMIAAARAEAMGEAGYLPSNAEGEVDEDAAYAAGGYDDDLDYGDDLLGGSYDDLSDSGYDEDEE